MRTLLLCAAVAAVARTALGGVCAWYTGDRQECGYVGIGETECDERDCCWRPTNKKDTPWCFHKVETQCARPAGDCGYVGITESLCRARGCCWRPVLPAHNRTDPIPPKRPLPGADEIEPLGQPMGQAWCLFGGSGQQGHVVAEVQPTAWGVRLGLVATQGTASSYGALISPLEANIYLETPTRLRIRITDPTHPRWEVPDTATPNPPLPTHKPAHTAYGVTHAGVGELFWVAVMRGSETLFNSSGQHFEYTNQYLQWGTHVPDTHGIYGLGEHIYDFRLPAATYTLFNYDTATPPLNNLYGSHPMHLQLGPQGTAHSVFLRSSNAMDVTVRPGALTYRVIGGIIDLFIATGPTPHEAIRQYADIVGRPYMPPLWALGFHQCRYGYRNLEEVEAVVANYSAALIPLDTMWVDIDYMDRYMDWSWHPTNFPQEKMRQFADTLHAQGQQFVTIVDPGIKAWKGNPAYVQGLRDDLFIKANDGTVFPGKVWPGAVAFPDFLHPNTARWWEESVAGFLGPGSNQSVGVDGLWIDMNELSNFCDGPCNTTINTTLELHSAGGVFYPNRPPYPVNNQNARLPLHTRTLSMDALHHGGVREYDAHNLYGLLEAKATRSALEHVRGKRAFVLSRSTFPGSGRHTAHWTGDNHSNWYHLAASIASVLAFQLFQVPLVGADICGFEESAGEELCARWAALGAFYPFSRNHNCAGEDPQEYYLWGSVTAAARKYLGMRYRLSPYLYTLFRRAHVHGDTVWRPLFFEFPSDRATHSLQHQFMFGPAMLVSPVVTPDTTSIHVYIPEGRWYDAATYQSVVPANHNGGFATLDVPIDTIGVHYRGGSVVGQFEAHALTLRDTWRHGNISVLVALDEWGAAQGELYMDDGETVDTADWLQVTFRVANGTLVCTPTANGAEVPAARRPITSVHVLGVPPLFAPYATANGQPVTATATNGTLLITGFSVAVGSPLTVVWGDAPAVDPSNMQVAGLDGWVGVGLGLFAVAVGISGVGVALRRQNGRRGAYGPVAGGTLGGSYGSLEEAR